MLRILSQLSFQAPESRFDFSQHQIRFPQPGLIPIREIGAQAIQAALPIFLATVGHILPVDALQDFVKVLDQANFYSGPQQAQSNPLPCTDGSDCVSLALFYLSVRNGNKDGSPRLLSRSRDRPSLDCARYRAPAGHPPVPAGPPVCVTG